MGTLERALAIAAAAHAGRVDKANQPYILHPMDLSRIANPTERDCARLEEYARVKRILDAGPEE